LWHLCCSEVSISPLFRWPNSVNHFTDNRARGKNDANKSPFVLLRNAMAGSVVRKLPIASQPYNDNHEKELVAFIKGLQ
ncbi:hypothetical protein U4W18_23890, partial [Escherichia coli]|nr:hypothetical protein [Escherichia coli]